MIGYDVTDMNSDCDLAGKAYIKSYSQCRRAATALGLTLAGSGDNEWNNYPKGCFQFKDNPSVYWNNIKDRGTINVKGANICMDTFMVTDMNSDCVRIGDVDGSDWNYIQSYDHCSIAATALGLTRAGEGNLNWSNYPKGCIQFEGNDHVYWNNIKRGEINTKGRSVCSAG